MLLSDAIERYGADRLAKGYARTTVRSQQTALKTFLVDVGNIHVGNILPRHMDVFWSRHADWSESNFNKTRGILMTFFKWCQVRGYMPRTADPMEGLRKQKVPQRERIIIPPGDFDAVLDAAANPRDRMIVAFGLYLFTRISETRGIRWGDINFEAKTIQVYRQKTKQMDTLPMCEELEHEVRRWRMEYGNLVGEVPKMGWYVVPSYSKPVFLGRRGPDPVYQETPLLIPTRAFSEGTKRVKLVLKRYGYPDLLGEGGHTLRRSGATALYQEMSQRGHDRAIRLCQAMLGHASIQTTEVYLRLDLERKARNDLLAGKRMFTSRGSGEVVELVGRAEASGEENTGGV